MRRLVAFTQVSLNGCFAGKDGDIGWAHRNDPEWNEFVAGNAAAGGVLVFGRITYEMMASAWQVPQARANAPVVAEQMNSLAKIVFSRTLDRATWNNTRLIKGDLAGAVRTLKDEPGDDMAILGSGSIVAELARERLIDEFQIVVYPLVLPAGRRLFDGVAERLDLRLMRTRAFGNGNVLLCYQPT